MLKPEYYTTEGGHTGGGVFIVVSFKRTSSALSNLCVRVQPDLPPSYTYIFHTLGEMSGSVLHYRTWLVKFELQGVVCSGMHKLHETATVVIIEK